MSTVQQEELLVPELFDALPESVLWFKPVWLFDEGAEQKQVIDFQVLYCNDAACTFLNAPKEAIINNRVLHNKLVDEAYQQTLFEQCLQVWQTGQPHEENFYNQHIGRYFTVLRSKTMGGVISIARDHTEAYFAEQERQKQTELLNSILDASINAVFACEAIRNNENNIINFRFLKINEMFTRLTGKTSEDVKGKTLLDCFPGAKATGIFSLYCQVVESGVALRKEIHYKAEGLDVWFDTSIVKLGQEGLVITFTDITESKNNKYGLEQNAQRLQTIINTSHSGIFTGAPIWNEQDEIVDFRFTLANCTLARYVGQEPEALVGRLGSEWFPGYKTNGLFTLFTSTYEQNTTQRFDFHYHQDGIDAWIDMMSTKMGGEVLVTFTDFTNLKHLQQKVETSAIRLNTVIDTSQVGIHTLIPVRDEEGTIIDFRFGIVNPTVAAYIGQTPEVLVGELASKWFPAYVTNGLFETYKNTFEKEETHRFNFNYQDGYDVYFDIMCTKMGGEVLVTFTDHTAIKQMQLQLEASVDELKRTNASLEEFAYAASHDMQEPLRKIHFFSDKLKSSLADRLQQEEKRMFERMELATQRMRNLIEDLLAYARTSMHTDAFEEVALDYLIDEVLMDMEASIAEKNAQITFVNLPKVRGDKRQLRQLFQNLVSNSLKYSKQNVSPAITITAQIVSGHHCTVHPTTDQHKQQYQQIEISDNGIGFNQEDAHRIFNVFQRLHGRSEYSGTGVGLAIVRKVVDNHLGCISAEGEENKGATFKILLPL